LPPITSSKQSLFAYKNGLRYPIGFLPISALFWLIKLIAPATTGADADVPPAEVWPPF